MKTILVTGATGMLGTAFRATIPSNLTSRVVLAGGPSRKNAVSEAGNLISGNLADKNFVNKLFEENEISYVIHCAANTNLSACEASFDKAFQDNVLASKNLVDALKSAASNGRFIYVSTDAVYPETGSMRSEVVVPNPANIYGMTKYMGELVVRQAMPSQSICLRTTIVGLGEGHFVDWVFKSAESGKPYKLFQDVFFSPISCWQFAKSVWDILEENSQFGIFNLASSSSCSKANFALQLLKSLKRNPGAYEFVNLSEMNSSNVSRNYNMTLDVTRFEKAFGTKLPDIDEVISDIVAKVTVRS